MQTGCLLKPGRIYSVALESPSIQVSTAEGWSKQGWVKTTKSSASGLLEFTLPLIAKLVCLHLLLLVWKDLQHI